MRHLRRPQYRVPTLMDTGSGGIKRREQLDRYSQDGTTPAVFPEHWTKPDVRGLLHAMQGRVCAYCGTETNCLEVEHFRPKNRTEGEADHAGYWWLAYEATNYFLSCTFCNRNRKGKRFPLAIGATRITFETRHDIRTERRVLLDPIEDPVEDWLAIESDDGTGRLVPGTNLNEAARERIQDVIAFFDLNCFHLRKQRLRTREEAERARIESRWEDLRRMSMIHRPHSLTARSVLMVNAPERLPTLVEEFLDLTYDLWKDLRTRIEEVLTLRARGKLPRGQDLRQVDSLCWALHVLSTECISTAGRVDNLLVQLLEQEQYLMRTEIIQAFRRLKIEAEG